MVVGSTYYFRGVSCLQATRENFVGKKKAKFQGRVFFGVNVLLACVV